MLHYFVLNVIGNVWATAAGETFTSLAKRSIPTGYVRHVEILLVTA
jgi:hypothetical protein